MTTRLNSFTFVKELPHLNLDSNHVAMTNFDIASLFINIPLDESIDIISNHVSTNIRLFFWP